MPNNFPGPVIINMNRSTSFEHLASSRVNCYGNRHHRN